MLSLYDLSKCINHISHNQRVLRNDSLRYALRMYNGDDWTRYYPKNEHIDTILTIAFPPTSLFSTFYKFT